MIHTRTHTLVKWRTNVILPYRQYSNVPVELIHRYLGPLTPYHDEEICLRTNKNLTKLLQFSLTRDQEFALPRITDYLYLMDNFQALVHTTELPGMIFHSGSITHIRMNRQPWSEVNKLEFPSQYCIASREQQLFSLVGGLFPLLNFTTPMEIKEKKLMPIPVEDLLQTIRLNPEG